MADPKIKRVLMSVTDKTGVVDFARALHDEFGAVPRRSSPRRASR